MGVDLGNLYSKDLHRRARDLGFHRLRISLTVVKFEHAMKSGIVFLVNKHPKCKGNFEDYVSNIYA